MRSGPGSSPSNSQPEGHDRGRRSTRFSGLRLDDVRIEKGEEGASGTTVFVTAFSWWSCSTQWCWSMAFPSCARSLKRRASRILEVLLSSVTAKELLAGKILGVGAVGLTQILVWVIFRCRVFSFPACRDRSLPREVHIPLAGIVLPSRYFSCLAICFTARCMLPSAPWSTPTRKRSRCNGRRFCRSLILSC